MCLCGQLVIFAWLLWNLIGKGVERGSDRCWAIETRLMTKSSVPRLAWGPRGLKITLNLLKKHMDSKRIARLEPRNTIENNLFLLDFAWNLGTLRPKKRLKWLEVT